MNQSILLVDDSVTIRRYARSILEGMTEGYEVTERENGALALHWLSSLVDTEFPGLIIIDRNMPEMSGDECVRIIKMDEDWQSIPLLFLTAQTADKQVVSGAEFLGADGYICKPFAPDELQSLVRRLISGTPDSSSASQQTAGVMVNAELDSTQVHHRLESEEPMMELFLAEAGEHAASMASGLQDLKAGNVDREMLAVMGRGAHSIKGAGGIVGLSAIAGLAGTLETYFKQVQKVPELLAADHLTILAVALELLTVFSGSPSDDIRTLEIERHDDIEQAKSRVDLLIGKGDDVTASSSILRGSPMDPRELDRGDKPSVSNVASGPIATTALETGLTSSRNIVVLLIDDQRIIGESVRSMLESESDIVFHFCQNPTEAVAKALEVQPTVILQDLVMPELDGLELVRRFRVERGLAAVPLIVLSGTEEAEVKAEAFALGANDYMVKLPNALEVIARIRYHSQAYINLLEREAAMARVTWLAEHDPLDGSSLVSQCEHPDHSNSGAVYAEITSEGVPAPMFMVRSGQYKLIQGGDVPPVLYDLANDPEERSNVADEPELTDTRRSIESLIQDCWDPASLEREIRLSQRRRRLVHAAHQKGTAPVWDHRPEDPTLPWIHRGPELYNDWAWLGIETP